MLLTSERGKEKVLVCIHLKSNFFKGSELSIADSRHAIGSKKAVANGRLHDHHELSFTHLLPFADVGELEFVTLRRGLIA